MNQGKQSKWAKPMQGMINDDKELVDLYLPRKCEYTGRIINTRDAASVQISVADVDEEGKALKKKTTVVLSGFVRAKGIGCFSLEKLLTDKGVLPVKE